MTCFVEMSMLCVAQDSYKCNRTFGLLPTFHPGFKPFVF